MMSVQFLAMIIIGGLGSVQGALIGTVFIVMLLEVLESLVVLLADSGLVSASSLTEGLAYFKEMTIGLVIILFLIFEPNGLAHRWKQIKAYWKYYPFAY